MDTELKSGVYEQIINKSLRKKLESLHDAVVRTAKLDGAESSVVLAKYLCEVLYGAFAGIDCDGDGDTRARIDFANKIISAITKETGNGDFTSMEVDESSEELTACIKKENNIYALYPNMEIPRPKTSLAESSLFTGSEKEPPLFSELKAEIKSCDRIDMLVSFIKWSGLRLIIDELEKFTQNGGQLRVITTSYMGATDVKAVEKLASLPNTEVMISYNTASTRLHAKAYLFVRDTGFTTSYIGSSNISKAALSSGLEWNLKVTQKDMPQTIKKVSAAFESYWNSPDFTKYEKSDKGRLEAALASEKTRGLCGLHGCNFDIIPYSYQKEILDKVEAERAIHGRYRNLIVAATGTGKTVISAFDYKRYVKENPLSPCRLLFVAHREEILEQSITCFRGVLKDQNFGELYVGSYKPNSIEHLFISVQSFNSADMTSKTSRDYYDFIVVDEFHHAAAPTYQKLLDYYEPKILLGLTATPERMDGRSVLEYFGGRIAAEIRLPEAIDRKLLSPFQYFGVTDGVDLSTLRWVRGGYDRTELSNLYTMSSVVARNRAVHIALSVEKYVTDIQTVKGLGFCVSVEHAGFMSDFFNSCSIPSIALHGGSSDSERDTARKKLVSGEIKFIFVVDLYNEGVDIPEINTVLFLRPTESLTVFLQQLGRGLRLAEEKECLTVLDFIGHANKKYNFEDKFAALLSNTNKNVEKELRDGFTSLPKGCYVQLEKKAAEFVLESIRNSICNRPELVKKIESFEEDFGLPLNLVNFVTSLKIDIRQIYSNEKNFARMCVDAGRREDFTECAETIMKRAFARICSINSLAWVNFLLRVLDKSAHVETASLTENEKRMLLMFHYTVFQKLPEDRLFTNGAEVLNVLRKSPVMLNELTELLKYLADKIDFVGKEIDLGYDCPLELHCSYTKDQILLALDHKNPASVREGVKYIAEKKTEILWVTLNKSEKDYSPSTMYDDYSINAELFHWQSQSTASESSEAGKRYINHAKTGDKILLFVRECKKDSTGTPPYTYLGPVTYVKHEGGRPMNITWKLENEIPAKYLKKTNKLGVA